MTTIFRLIHKWIDIVAIAKKKFSWMLFDVEAGGLLQVNFFKHFIVKILKGNWSD